MNDLVSVIVPVYKVEQYLSRCINSILNQTYKHFELVLVDDGSPDNCGKICEDYAALDSRIHVIHQENGGLSSARNAGIDWVFQNSQSEWLTFVDSDDWIHPNYIELLLSAANVRQVAVAVSLFYITNGEDFPDEPDENVELWNTRDFYRQDVVNATTAWGKLYRKECFKEIRYPVNKVHEDEYVTYRIIFQHEYIAVVRKSLYAYFQNMEGITKGEWDVRRLDAIEGLEGQVKFFLNHGYEDLARMRFIALLYTMVDHQTSLYKSASISNKEKKRYGAMIRKKIRSNLLTYREYGWAPFQNYKYVYFCMFNATRKLRNLKKQIEKIRAESRTSSTKTLIEGSQDKRSDKSHIEEKQLVKTYSESIISVDAILFQTPLHGNLGDQAIAESETDLLNKLNITYCEFPWTSGLEDYCGKVTHKKKLVLISGGGNLGQLWPEEECRFRATLQAFYKNSIIVLPQTVYFDLNTEEGRKCFLTSKQVYESHPNLIFFVREKYSYQFMKKYMPRVHTELVPDVAMLLEWKSSPCLVRHGCLICLRSDKEKTLSEFEEDRIRQIIKERYTYFINSDTVIPISISQEHRSSVLKTKLMEIATSQLVVTDRLHGMIFSAITDTPCIVLNSLSHKVRGCYEWISDLDYIRLAETIDEVPAIIDELKNVKPRYNREKIEEAMKPLYEALINGST